MSNDYSPLVAGSKEYKQAVQARSEMLGHLSRAPSNNKPVRKTWEERMLQRADGFVKR